MSLSFDAEIRAAFLECCFDGPTAHEPFENFHRRRIEIRARKCLGIAHADAGARAFGADADDDGVVAAAPAAMVLVGGAG